MTPTALAGIVVPTNQWGRVREHRPRGDRQRFPEADRTGKGSPARSPSTEEAHMGVSEFESIVGPMQIEGRRALREAAMMKLHTAAVDIERLSGHQTLEFRRIERMDGYFNQTRDRIKKAAEDISACIEHLDRIGWQDPSRRAAD